MKYFLLMIVLVVYTSGYGQSVEESSEMNLSKSYALDNSDSQFVIKGTSSLHDWEMISNNFKGNITFTASSGNLSIEKILVNVGVTTLESGKGIMDRKCYNALKKDSYPTIKYHFKNLKSLKNTGGNAYSATLVGSLSIAGQTKDVDIQVTIAITENSVIIKGEKPLKMSDFGVEPPTALLGTLKTGDPITIVFNLNYL